MNLRPNLLSRSLGGVSAAAGSMGDALRRLRYRQANLRRITAIEMISDGSSDRGRFEWISAVRFRGRPHEALACSCNSRITYEVVLPPRATVMSWCAVEMKESHRGSGAVEFELTVRAQGFDSSARCRIDSKQSRRWQSMRITTPEAGPARIVLTTRVIAGGATEGTALWGDPCIRAPRAASDIASAIDSTISYGGLRTLWHRVLPPGSDRLYSLWVRETEPSRAALRAQREWSEGRARSLSLVTFVADPATWRPDRTIASVLDQTYAAWEWMLVAPEHAIGRLRAATARVARDPRVRLVSVASDSRRADAWNAGFEAGRGEFGALLGERDVLSPSALYEIAAALERSPASDVLYSDEDRTAGRRRHDPRFKPDWSPELLVSHNYVGRLAMIRTSALKLAGGFQDQFTPGEEWELLLRLSRAGARFQRIPRCLYHGADVDSPASGGSADRSPDAVPPAILADHFGRVGLEATVTASAGISRIVWNHTRQPSVSIVIPNRDAAAVIQKCVAGLTEHTRYPHRQVVIVDNGSTDREVLDLYASLERRGCGLVVPFNRPFNFSAACNAGAAAAGGELLLFLNNDIEVLEPEWLDELVRWALRPEIGIVGAKLLYPDRTIQHAGVVFGVGLVGHIFARAPEGTSGVFGSTESYRNYLAVTGACQMMRKEVFQHLGGYDERLRLSFSDVILCMEAWKAGLRVVYTPYARLIHHESYTRKREDSAEDMALLARYLKASSFVEDPYFHPELDAKAWTPAVRPPFDPMPRQVVADYIDRVLAAAVPQNESCCR